MCHDECELCFTCVVFSSRHGCPSWWPPDQGWLLSRKLCKLVNLAWGVSFVADQIKNSYNNKKVSKNGTWCHAVQGWLFSIKLFVHTGEPPSLKCGFLLQHTRKMKTAETKSCKIADPASGTWCYGVWPAGRRQHYGHGGGSHQSVAHQGR